MEVFEQTFWYTPSLLFFAFALLGYSVFLFHARRYGGIMGTGVILTAISPLLTTSIGPIIFGIGLIQLYMGIVNLKKEKVIKPDKSDIY